MPRKKHTALHFIRPANTGWELWTLSGPRGAVLLQTFESLSQVKKTPNCIMGLPVAAAFHLPLWFVRTEPEYVSELIAAQLEKRGLLNNDIKSTIFGSETVAATETHDLRLITVVPDDISTELVPAWCDHFDLAARYLNYEGDSVYIWKELGSIAVAFVRHGKSCHFQALSHRTLDINALFEINTIQLALEVQNVVHTPTQLRLLGDFTQEEILAAKESFEGNVINQHLPAPRLPSIRYDLTPNQVKLLKTQEQKQAQIRKTITYAAVSYVFLFILLGVYLLGLNIYKQMLASELASKRPAYEQISLARSKWNSIESTIDPASSFLEILYQLSNLLKEEGVRFTSFEMDSESITIQAEASDHHQAFLFVEDVKRSPDLTLYTWESPEPRLLPNNKAQFQILGRSIYASTNLQ